MSRQYDFAELQEDLKELLNFNSSQTDQDFTTNQIKKSINRAYTREVNKAKQHGVQEFFKAIIPLTWPASQVTLELPQSLKGRELLSFIDVTDNDPGVSVPMGPDYVHWKDSNTLQWGTAGPSSARTLRVEVFASPIIMNDDADEPDLIPVDHRELIVYSAGIELRRMADEVAPPAWVSHYQELQMDFWKATSRGRPHGWQSRIRWADGISIGSPAVTQDGSSIGN